MTSTAFAVAPQADSVVATLVVPTTITSIPGVLKMGAVSAATTLSARGATAKAVDVIAERVLEPMGLRRAHERLFTERGVRYLACEGGEQILRALHVAGLLDEVFVTLTDQVIDESAHEGVLKIFNFASEGADLIAEGKVSLLSNWTFRRWRFNAR